jgi:hypothetical protein
MEHRLIPPGVAESFLGACAKLVPRELQEPCWHADPREDSPAERIVCSCKQAPIPPGRALRLCRWRAAGLFRDP